MGGFFVSGGGRAPGWIVDFLRFDGRRWHDVCCPMLQETREMAFDEDDGDERPWVSCQACGHGGYVADEIEARECPDCDQVQSFERQDVRHVPEILHPGVLYVSADFGVAVHLCACGCGGEVVTPLRPQSPNGWTLDGTTLRPCIGNQSWACGSHYYVTKGRIQWL